MLIDGTSAASGAVKGVSGAIRKLFDTLLNYYGEQPWWPCQSGTRWEIITGAILTQNTAWTNVEKAIGNLLTANIMSPQRVLETADAELQELIRPAGFFKQKCAYLKAMVQLNAFEKVKKRFTSILFKTFALIDQFLSKYVSTILEKACKKRIETK